MEIVHVSVMSHTHDFLKIRKNYLKQADIQIY